MIEAIVSPKVSMNEFPKLMEGINTGTIYLVTESNLINHCIQYTTIVLAHKKDSLQTIGEVAIYKPELLKNFHGQVTLKG